MTSNSYSSATEHAHEPQLRGLKRWLLTTNHKEIGTLYLIFSLTMFFIGGTMALVIRAELFQPGLQLVQPEFFNQMTTMHGLIMVFGAVMPAFVGLANWMVPLQIGAPDMALPRLNNFSFWLLPLAFSLLLSSLFMEGGGPNFGWTFYAPLSTTYAPPSTNFFILSIHLAGISSILGAINIIATILNMRTPAMKLMDMPLFVWTWLITAFLLLAVMPVLAAFARKRLFGYRSMVYATASIAILSFVVWAHHMFTVGLPLAAQLFFMYATMLIAVPTGVKVFNWVATLFHGSISFEVPMLFTLAFIVQFTIGGLSGVMLAIVPADYQYHDTYFVVAHFHYVLVPGAVFAIIAGVYYWLPKWTGYYPDETLGRWHFWLSVIGVNLTFFPMHFSGLAGMPRRIPDYALQFADFNLLSSLGGFLFGLSQLLLVWVVVRCVRGGKPAPDNPWEGAEGLEWTVPSPAPLHTFSTPPEFIPERDSPSRA